MPKLRIDLHCHSAASPDSLLTARQIGRVLGRGRLDVIAITDHDRIDGALALQAQFGERIIVGEEITTQQGEIIGLFLQQRITPGMTAADTVEAIQRQCGLVYIPHPFETVRKGLTLGALDTIVQHVDIIETQNGRSFSRKARLAAGRYAQEHGLATAAASDAHGAWGWGRVYSVVAAHPTPETLANLLCRGSQTRRTNGIVSYGYPKLARTYKRLTRKKHA